MAKKEIPMAITCCHHCYPPKRQVGCHAWCKDYLEQRCELNAENETRRQAKLLEQAAIESVIKTMMKETKKKNKRRLK